MRKKYDEICIVSSWRRIETFQYGILYGWSSIFYDLLESIYSLYKFPALVLCGKKNNPGTTDQLHFPFLAHGSKLGDSQTRNWLPSGKTNIAMENHHFQQINHWTEQAFCIAMLVYWRVLSVLNFVLGIEEKITHVQIFPGLPHLCDWDDSTSIHHKIDTANTSTRPVVKAADTEPPKLGGVVFLQP